MGRHHGEPRQLPDEIDTNGDGRLRRLLPAVVQGLVVDRRHGARKSVRDAAQLRGLASDCLRPVDHHRVAGRIDLAGGFGHLREVLDDFAGQPSAVDSVVSRRLDQCRHRLHEGDVRRPTVLHAPAHVIDMQLRAGLFLRLIQLLALAARRYSRLPGRTPQRQGGAEASANDA
ncbi:hypothetical protein [Streptomyces europaeiscabiei]|uniref:hypothetical protein n=1 Tax=Streptomyces europaeiscabiei TaxID=146819 RepID=UPI0038F69045